MCNRKYLSMMLAFICITASPWLFAEDAFEENDNFGTAATLSLGTHANLEAIGEDDWFKLESLNPGLLHIEMSHVLPGDLNNGTNDINVVLFNSSNQVIAANNGNNVTEQFDYHVIIPGDYYIRVFPTNGGTNTYTLIANRVAITTGDDSNEENDSFDTPTVIANYNQPVTGQVAKDEDWFTIAAPAGTFTVTVTYDGGTNLQLEGYGSAGNRLNNSTGSSGTVSIELDIATADTIFLAVVGGMGANYTLTVDHPVVWTKLLTSGWNSASSPTIFDVDSDGKGEIFIGSRPHLVANEEVKPAELVVLEHDGTVKWRKSFPAISGIDPVTGRSYQTSSISTRPAVADLDGDGDFEVIVGVGADLDNVNPTTMEIYSPGHNGAVYALDALTGDQLWVSASLDTINAEASDSGCRVDCGDGLPDGVISSPIVCDLDQDGTSEVIWGGWDQRVHVVNGRDGSVFGAAFGSKWPVAVDDTNWSTPLCADINDDGLHEILIGGDITENPDALTLSGGLFHVYDRWGRDIIDGFGTPLEFTPDSGIFSFLKGKYEEQTIWSSPIVGDLDGDGTLEIAYGTGLFFDSSSLKGRYIRIWNHDGTEYLKLETPMGRTFAVPLFADINNNGNLEIIAATASGWIYAWTNTGNQLFATQTFPSGGTGADHPIYSSPLAVDMDGDGDLEIIYQQGPNIVIVDHNGEQLTDATKWELTNETFRGTPAVGDLDGDGNLEIIAGGANDARDTGMVYAFKYGTPGNATATGGSYKYARRQFRESGVVPISAAQVSRRAEVRAFVTRFYTEVLGRSPDSMGLADWINRLLEGDRSGGDVGRGFVLSSEFTNVVKTDEEFLVIMYLAFFNRAAGPAELSGWLQFIDDGNTRTAVLNGFIGAPEFLALSNSFNITFDFAATQGLKRKLVNEFMTRFYNQILLRSPDTPGLNGWTDALMLGTLTGSDVANGFVGSDEFVARALGTEDYVKVLYRAFFGRSADPVGLQLWLNALDNGTLTRQQVLDSFVNSAEFSLLATGFGISPS